jgi:hypothetical protein
VHIFVISNNCHKVGMKHYQKTGHSTQHYMYMYITGMDDSSTPVLNLWFNGMLILIILSDYRAYLCTMV